MIDFSAQSRKLDRASAAPASASRALRKTTLRFLGLNRFPGFCICYCRGGAVEPAEFVVPIVPVSIERAKVSEVSSFDLAWSCNRVGL